MSLSYQPTLGFVGAGRLARCLALAASRGGYRVVGVASQSTASAAALAQPISGCRHFEDPQHVVDACDLVFVTVPDDAIEPIAAKLRYAPQSAADKALVHCSGASAVSLLDAAHHQGVATGGFHPLYLFSGSAADVERLAGCSITIEAPPALEAVLRRLSAALGCAALEIPAGTRMLYHAAANYAASFVLCGLSETVALWRHLGLDETQTLDAVWPMLAGTLQAASEKGLAGALAGPVSRGDAGVVQTQLEILSQMGGDHAQLYALMTRRAVALARRRPTPPASLDAIDALLDRVAVEPPR